MVPFRIQILGCLAVILLGCSSGSNVDGVWQTAASDTPVSLDVLFPDYDGRMQLALGQYGKDVAGTLRLYTTAFSLSHQFETCPCAYVERGEFQGNVFTFSFEACGGTRLIGVFEKGDDGDDEILRGVFQDELGTPLTGEISFARVGNDDQILEEELNQGCPAD